MSAETAEATRPFFHLLSCQTSDCSDEGRRSTDLASLYSEVLRVPPAALLSSFEALSSLSSPLFDP